MFAEVQNFRELENRIVDLPSEQDRGAAFEVFAEAYFATQQIHQARAVWPNSSAPLSLIERVGLTRSDQGCDGVIETKTNEVVSYQAKFRTGRSHLTWAEISTFMGQTDQVDRRILITNSTSIAAVAKTRKRFCQVGGDVLDHLKRADFERIESWLKGAVVPEKVLYTPKPHQSDAIKKITNELAKASRTTAPMACGTGKTLTALWVSEQLSPKSVLILVPSLSLLRQLLREWIEQTSWKDFSYLCVCSDSTVNEGNDAIVLKTSDLEFDVGTDSNEVYRFMNLRTSGVKLVFGTYQSADVIGKAAKEAGYKFDLGIFDEAHKTAGRAGRAFAYALHDRNIFINRRLFLTATPRHFDILKKDKDGELTPIFSMDDPNIYGKISYSLPFLKAVEEGIICPFKVIISVITNEQLSTNILKHGTTEVRGDLVKSQQVANQLALANAVQEYKVKKIFSFHSTVSLAASFVSDGPEGIWNHLPDFQCNFISGKMPTDKRENILKEFRDAKAAIVSNARCLTEGVDVPSVDMVGFFSPKRSQVDIVQAAGRAMRRNDKSGKKIGIILIPLYVEQAKNENLEDALARTNFDHIWGTLQALQEQDEVLAEIICQMREERGLGVGFNDTRFREKVEVLGPSLSLSMLQRSIALACIDRLGSNWDERFGELRAFKAREGHCNVPRNYEVNPALAGWVKKQRSNQDKLHRTRVERLNSLDFEWNLRITAWDSLFSELSDFKKREGHCNVPRKYKENRTLSTWVGTQRTEKHKLSPERLRKLNSIGFDWDPLTSIWERMFSELENFKCREGHCNVGVGNKETSNLAAWVRSQRARKGKLEPTRVSRLNALGFIWTPYEVAWEEMFLELVSFRNREGHCNVPYNYEGNHSLFLWVRRQRLMKKRLSADRITRLVALEFDWDPISTAWDRMFVELKAFKKSTGHCRVPGDYEKNPSLGVWVGAKFQLWEPGDFTLAEPFGAPATLLPLLV